MVPQAAKQAETDKTVKVEAVVVDLNPTQQEVEAKIADSDAEIEAEAAMVDSDLDTKLDTTHEGEVDYDNCNIVGCAGR